MGWRPKLGYPPECIFVKLMKPVVAMGNSDDGYADAFWEGMDDVEEHTLRVLDACIQSLPKLQEVALRMIYLREIGPEVLKSGRMSLEDAGRLCDAAENALIPMLRAKGIVLANA